MFNWVLMVAIGEIVNKKVYLGLLLPTIYHRSGGNSTQIHYLIRKLQLKLQRGIKFILGEGIATQNVFSRFQSC